MKLEKRQRRLADAVLSYLEIMCNAQHEDVECTVNSYINGREYGYTITLAHVGDRYIFSKDALWVAFSENRNSDHIVVYTDETLWDDEITEKSYENRKLFEFSEAYEAAKYVYSLIENKANSIREAV